MDNKSFLMDELKSQMRELVVIIILVVSFIIFASWFAFELKSMNERYIKIEGECK